MRVCAACSVLPLIKVKGSPTTKMAVPSTVATAPPDLASRRSAVVPPAVAGGFGRLSPARAKQGVKLNTAAKMRTVRRGAITVFIGWNLSSVRFQGHRRSAALPTAWVAASIFFSNRRAPDRRKAPRKDRCGIVGPG
jgi:hypothetical protein